MQRTTRRMAGPGADRPPICTTAPPPGVAVGAAYSYDADVLDVDGDAVTFSLPEAPAGMTIVSATGLVEWDFAEPGASTRARASS